MDNVIVAVQYHSISITAHLCAEPASGYVIVRNGGESIYEPVAPETEQGVARLGISQSQSHESTHC